VQQSRPSDTVLESPSCIARIQSLRERLTPAQQRVADAVLEDPHEVILATVAELAKRSGASDAAVSRFARILGYAGYPEFKLALARDLVSTTEDIHEDVLAGDTVIEIANKVAMSNGRAIEDTLRGLDHRALAEAVAALASASRIAFFGFGGSGVVARDARHHFLRTMKETVTFEDPYDQITWAATSRATDVLMLFSHTGTSRDLCDVAEVSRAEGSTVISVTNHGISPLTEVADISLFTSSRETRYRPESMSSRIAAMTLIDILYVAISLEFSDEQAQLRDRIRRAVYRKRIEVPRLNALPRSRRGE